MMRKAITMMAGLVALGLLGVTVARADTLTSLPIPAELRTAYGVQCSGNAFNADDSISGACSYRHSGACSGRGCQPATYTYYYVMSWAADLTPGVPVLCESVRHHLPQANQYTWYTDPSTGLPFTSCPPVSFWEPTVVTINGVPYYYVTTSADGAFELVNTQSSTLLVAF